MNLELLAGFLRRVRKDIEIIKSNFNRNWFFYSISIDLLQNPSRLKTNTNRNGTTSRKNLSFPYEHKFYSASLRRIFPWTPSGIAYFPWCYLNISSGIEPFKLLLANIVYLELLLHPYTSHIPESGYSSFPTVSDNQYSLRNLFTSIQNYNKSKWWVKAWVTDIKYTFYFFHWNKRNSFRANSNYMYIYYL